MRLPRYPLILESVHDTALNISYSTFCTCVSTSGWACVTHLPCDMMEIKTASLGSPSLLKPFWLYKKWQLTQLFSNCKDVLCPIYWKCEVKSGPELFFFSLKAQLAAVNSCIAWKLNKRRDEVTFNPQTCLESVQISIRFLHWSVVNSSIQTLSQRGSR